MSTTTTTQRKSLLAAIGFFVLQQMAAAQDFDTLTQNQHTTTAGIISFSVFNFTGL